VTSRRDFLTAFKKPLEQKRVREEQVVRPPYGISEKAFLTHCPACEAEACVTACEEKIILIRADKTPMLNFKERGCTFCDACAEACPEGVLNIANRHSATRINARFIIDPNRCVAHAGVVCFACKEPCIDDAILFNGMFNPVIDAQRCTGCGFCQGRCPSAAVVFEAIPYPSQKEAE